MASLLHFATAGEGWLLELSDGGGLGLELLPPALEAAGQSWNLALGDPVRVPATDRLGAGERLTGMASGGPADLEVRFELMLYRDRPAAAWSCYLTNRSAGPVVLGVLRLLDGCVTLPGDGEARVYVNSGNQGFSGVVPAGPEARESAFVTAIHRPGSATFTAGGLSYARAEVRFTTTVHGSAAHCMAECPYAGWSLPPGETLASETLWLSFEPDPLAALEEYGDAVARWLGLSVSPDRGGLWNLYYTYSKRDVHEVNAADIRAGARRLGETLAPYGLRHIDWGCWQRGHAFMEDRPWEGHFPERFDDLALEVRALGVDAEIGAFAAYVTETTPLFQEHPEWLVRDEAGQPRKLGEQSWRRCPHPYYALDVTHPGAAAWYEAFWRRLGCGGLVKYLTLDFDGTAVGGRADPAVVQPLEADRRRYELIRRAVGGDALIGVYTSPTNRFVGLLDRARLASDISGYRSGWEHAAGVARNLAAGWFYDGRWWQNDPDAVALPPSWEPPYPEMMRVRWMISGLLGGFVSVAGDLLELTEEEWRWFTLLLPSYGRVALPLDLFTSPLPSLLDLSVSTSWDTWHVVGLINWTEEVQERTLEFARLVPAPSGPQRVFEFWEKEDLGEQLERLPLTLPPRSARLLRIAPERPHPWLLASEMHLTQGGVEVSDLRWSRERLTLRGVCRRPRGARGTLRVTVPLGWTLVEFRARRAALPIESAPGSAAVALEFPDDEPLVWEARYEKAGPGRAAARAARVETVTPGPRFPVFRPTTEGGAS